MPAEPQPDIIETVGPLALIAKRDLARLLAINEWTLDRWRRAGGAVWALLLGRHNPAR
jgi:hypothetical protein